MSARRVSVRKIREMLRLLWECGLSQRQVAGCCGIGKTTVADCVVRARRSGLDWSTAAALSDEEPGWHKTGLGLRERSLDLV
jgi:transposase